MAETAPVVITPDVAEPGTISTLTEPVPDGLAELGAYPDHLAAAERGLVVLARGCAYWVFPGAGGYHLYVEGPAREMLQRELAAYERERTGWPPPPVADPWPGRKPDLLTPLLWSASILAIFLFAPTVPWREAGALEPVAIFGRDEWWRIGTALFLHADAAHVISNALSGLLVFTAVLWTFGRARGWLLVALGAFAGNLAVATVNAGSAYRSVGASTAIFAGIGLLTGRALWFASRSRAPHRWRAMFTPLGAGVTVLALYGAGGLRVDVGAHALGFVAGIVVGAAAAWRDRPATK